jgi:hypothetical protein
MNWRNRIGLYGSYFLGMAAIGFTLPYLPLYMSEKGLSDRAIGIVSTLAAISGLAQFPVGLWSDRIGWRKPFLVVALAVTALATMHLRGAQGFLWVSFLVILFAENGICRAVVESLSGAEAAALALPGGVGAALGAIRFWKPVGIILVALAGSWITEQHGVGAMLPLLAVVQGLAVGVALLIHEPEEHAGPHQAGGERGHEPSTRHAGARVVGGWLPRDAGLWAFVALVYRPTLAELVEVPREEVAPARPCVHRRLLIKSLAVTLATVGFFFAGRPIALVALVASGVLLLDRVRPEKVFGAVDWPLLVMFPGLFVVVHAFEVNVVRMWGLDQWHALLESPVVLVSGLSVLLSNLVSNVPAVLLFKPLMDVMPQKELAWLALAMSSTLAGNLTVLGSVANLIVVESAHRAGTELGFLEYLKVGVPLTVLTTLAGVAWLTLVAY